MITNTRQMTLLGISISAIFVSVLFIPQVQAGIPPTVSSTDIKGDFPPFAGPPVTVKSSAKGDVDSEAVQWILPGKRALDPKLFGTVAEPLGFEPDVGVPIAARDHIGPNWTFTKMLTPFSNMHAAISGEYKLLAKDRTLFDDPQSKDKVKFSAKFTSPIIGLNLSSHTYEVNVKKVVPVGPDHPFMGGVGTNFVHHGMTGIGTKLMPTSPTFVAFWGVATLTVDGDEVEDKRLVHLMTTCRVRDANYNLVFDKDEDGMGGADCSKIHTHILLPNIALVPNPDKLGTLMPMMKPVPTEFNLPTDPPSTQPFLHIMFENIKIDGVKTKIES